MKKYYRLTLLVVTLISLSLFLAYRNAYNRLHYVLEVFNFFGQPCNFSSLERSADVLDHHDWGPSPLWRETDKIHLYSAFWTNGNEVKAIVAVPTTTAHARGCFLWYEDRRRAVVGKFRYAKAGEEVGRSVNVFFYYCAGKGLIAPYAVSFSSKNKLVDSKRILLTDNIRYQPRINVTVCVVPTPFNKTKFVEFLSFHRLIGVNSFIFYGGSVPHRISKLITNLADRLDIRATFFPWNSPYNDRSLTQEIVTQDCILRNRNQSFYATVLDVDSYIVPYHYSTLLEVLGSIEQSSQKISLPLLKFCLQHANPDRPMVLQNTDMLINGELGVVDVHRVNYLNQTVSVQEFDRSFAAVHRYVHCNGSVKKTLDTSILKYSTDFIRTTLVQMLKNDAL